MTYPNRTLEILLIEDCPADIDLTLESLTDTTLSRRIHTVTDGEAALDFMFQRGKYTDAPRPDLILLDLNLPRKDGREVLAEIKARLELKHIPVIVLTSSDSERDVLASYQLQANCYIVKPIGLAAFQQTLKCIELFWFKTARLAPISIAASLVRQNHDGKTGD